MRLCTTFVQLCFDSASRGPSLSSSVDLLVLPQLFVLVKALEKAKGISAICDSEHMHHKKIVLLYQMILDCASMPPPSCHLTVKNDSIQSVRFQNIPPTIQQSESYDDGVEDDAKTIEAGYIESEEESSVVRSTEEWPLRLKDFFALPGLCADVYSFLLLTYIFHYLCADINL